MPYMHWLTTVTVVLPCLQYRAAADGKCNFIKENRQIDYSPFLDMMPFVSKALMERGESTRYELRAVQLHHGGEPRSGHWTSLQQICQQKWVIYNDTDKPQVVERREAFSFKRDCSMFVYMRVPSRLVLFPQCCDMLHKGCVKALCSSSTFMVPQMLVLGYLRAARVGVVPSGQASCLATMQCWLLIYACDHNSLVGLVSMQLDMLQYTRQCCDNLVCWTHSDYVHCKCKAPCKPRYFDLNTNRSSPTATAGLLSIFLLNVRLL